MHGWTFKVMFHFLFHKKHILDRNFTVVIRTQIFLTVSAYANHSVYSRQNKLSVTLNTAVFFQDMFSI